jgi:hypothetical protein
VKTLKDIRDPDILISPMLDDERYIIQFNTDRINSNLIGKLEKEIKEISSIKF